MFMRETRPFGKAKSENRGPVCSCVSRRHGLWRLLPHTRHTHEMLIVTQKSRRRQWLGNNSAFSVFTCLFRSTYVFGSNARMVCPFLWSRKVQPSHLPSLLTSRMEVLNCCKCSLCWGQSCRMSDTGRPNLSRHDLQTQILFLAISKMWGKGGKA